MTPTQDRIEIEELKASVDLAAVMESYGVLLKQSSKSQLGRCPFHDDDKPSLSVTGGLFQCFGCQASLTATEFGVSLGITRSFDGDGRSGLIEPPQILQSQFDLQRAQILL